MGSLSQQWHYLLKHVRSKAHVHHIRGNLILEHHRQKLKASRHADQSILPNIESTIASGFNPDIEDERAQLLAEYKDLTRRIQKSTLRMTQNETRIRQYRRDVRWQTDLRRNTEIELNERRLAAQLLHRFATQGRKEVTRLSSWAKDLRDLESDESGSTIFRSLKQEEKLFAHEGMDIKTSAQVTTKNKKFRLTYLCRMSHFKLFVPRLNKFFCFVTGKGPLLGTKFEKVDARDKKAIKTWQ